jgi:hypothetical protein
MSNSLPNAAQYGPEQIVPDGVEYQVNRAAYAAAHGGEQLPAFVVGQPVKRWRALGLDLSNPDAPYKFIFLDKDAQGQPRVNAATIAVGLAAIFNLPGSVVYQKYADWAAEGLKPTRSVSLFNFAGTVMRVPLDPHDLLTPDLAQQLATEIGNGATVVEQTPDLPHDYDSADPRRLLYIQIGGENYNAGRLFASRSSMGVWSPGAWSVAVDGPRFTSIAAPTGEIETRNVPIPVRSLISPPERLAVDPFGAILIQRTDMAPFNVPAAGGAAGLTSEQDERLKTIEAKVRHIDSFMPGGQS